MIRIPIFKSKNKFIPVDKREKEVDPKFMHSLARQLKALKETLKNG